MRIAIVHDWLVVYAGAERVLEQIIRCFPEADLFSLIDFIPENHRDFVAGKQVNTSFLQNFPRARTKYRAYLPLMPLAIEQFDLSSYDLIISSSHAVAKGILVGPDQLHVCMCYSPIRYAWDMQHAYLKESGLDRGVKGWMARWILHYIRQWDVRTAAAVDRFIGISHFIARRIEKVYRREADVIYPPVDVSSFILREDKEEFYLAASRMVPYKKMPLIVEAFTAMPDKRLVVIGEGPDLERCKAVAGTNVEVMGWQPFGVLRDYMQRARAFVFASEEDFGIAPLEAQACGTPVIAYGKGAVLETIKGLDTRAPSGVFFTEQTCVAIESAVSLFEKESARITPQACRENSMRFSDERFRTELMNLISREIETFFEKSVAIKS